MAIRFCARTEFTVNAVNVPKIWLSRYTHTHTGIPIIICDIPLE